MRRFTPEEMKKVKRLYRNCPWRIAKKHLGRCSKLIYGLDLKPGDLVSTCKGWNEPIAEIYPEWRRLYSRHKDGVGKGETLLDFDIITVSGSSHSLIHCCTFPLETKEEIINYWLGHQGEEYENWVVNWYGGGDKGRKKYEESFEYRIVQALKMGQEVFLPDGQINKEWVSG